MISTGSIYTLHEHLFLTILNRGRRLLRTTNYLLWLNPLPVYYFITCLGVTAYHFSSTVLHVMDQLFISILLYYMLRLNSLPLTTLLHVMTLSFTSWLIYMLGLNSLPVYYFVTCYGATHCRIIQLLTTI